MSAPPEVTIEVTWADIQKGERDNSCRCPIAQAVARQYGYTVSDYYTTRVMVDPLDLGIIFDPATDEFDTYDLPYEARKFIRDFDADGRHAVTPFTFTAKLLDPS